jgi:hypothetical protein
MPRRPLVPQPLFRPQKPTAACTHPHPFATGRYIASKAPLVADGPDVFFDALDRLHALGTHGPVHSCGDLSTASVNRPS